MEDGDLTPILVTMFGNFGDRSLPLLAGRFLHCRMLVPINRWPFGEDKFAAPIGGNTQAFVSCSEEIFEMARPDLHQRRRAILITRHANDDGIAFLDGQPVVTLSFKV